MITINQNTCKGCGAKILWIKNENGKPEPFDAQPTRILRVEGDRDADGTPVHFLEEGKLFQVVTGHVNHFVLCPNSNDFRKTKETTR